MNVRRGGDRAVLLVLSAGGGFVRLTGMRFFSRLSKYVCVLCGLPAVLALFAGCASVSKPQGVEPVGGFELSRYLGKWYEIARLDHSFERGMDAVSAEYSLRDDGGVKVVNRGFLTDKGKWKEAIGRAYFVQDPQTGFLKVSFFGPFFGSYVIFELDKENYQYAFVSGPDLSYLWLLARTPTVEPELLQRFIERSKELGFDTGALIFPAQELNASELNAKEPSAH